MTGVIAGEAVGTERYMCPEFLKVHLDLKSCSTENEKREVRLELKRKIKRRGLSDVFSLGLTIYEMATLTDITHFN